MLDRVQPDLAVLSVGHNYYGHPHDVVLERYAARGIPVWRTDEAGTVTVRLDAEGVSVWSELEQATSTSTSTSTSTPFRR